MNIKENTGPLVYPWLDIQKPSNDAEFWPKFVPNSQDTKCARHFMQVTKALTINMPTFFCDEQVEMQQTDKLDRLGQNVYKTDTKSERYAHQHCTQNITVMMEVLAEISQWGNLFPNPKSNEEDKMSRKQASCNFQTETNLELNAVDSVAAKREHDSEKSTVCRALGLAYSTLLAKVISLRNFIDPRGETMLQMCCTYRLHGVNQHVASLRLPVPRERRHIQTLISGSALNEIYLARSLMCLKAKGNQAGCTSSSTCKSKPTITVPIGCDAQLVTLNHNGATRWHLDVAFMYKINCQQRASSDVEHDEASNLEMHFSNDCHSYDSID
ncbi:hypothetical protein CLF_111639 [Clonorchis sinensis]|uniref:Uncharacterized protein n=1 Tax=Clonorchis sinensis TaxID=79923 RepID=G7YV57_CLOSI|nr:hypothetical protein CLF_111639 [Clonorchis sinensis]